MKNIFISVWLDRKSSQLENIFSLTIKQSQLWCEMNYTFIFLHFIFNLTYHTHALTHPKQRERESKKESLNRHPPPRQTLLSSYCQTLPSSSLPKFSNSLSLLFFLFSSLFLEPTKPQSLIWANQTSKYQNQSSLLLICLAMSLIQYFLCDQSVGKTGFAFHTKHTAEATQVPCSFM